MKKKKYVYTDEEHAIWLRIVRLEARVNLLIVANLTVLGALAANITIF